MPDENYLPSLPGSAASKHRMSPIPAPEPPPTLNDAASSDVTLVADADMRSPPHLYAPTGSPYTMQLEI